MCIITLCIEEHYSTLHLPWTGLTLVLTCDDSRADRVGACIHYIHILFTRSPIYYIFQNNT